MTWAICWTAAVSWRQGWRTWSLRAIGWYWVISWRRAAAGQAAIVWCTSFSRWFHRYFRGSAQAGYFNSFPLLCQPLPRSGWRYHWICWSSSGILYSWKAGLAIASYRRSEATHPRLRSWPSRPLHKFIASFWDLFSCRQFLNLEKWVRYRSTFPRSWCWWSCIPIPK